MAERGTFTPRVILGATCFADADASLHIAVLLAEELNSEVHGVFAIDHTVLASASQSGVRVVEFAGGGLSQVTCEDMLHAMRTDARMFRKKLLLSAQQASLVADFREAAGPLVRAVQYFAESGDLVIFGFKREIRNGDSIVLLTGPKGLHQISIALAARLSERLRKDLVVFDLGGHRAEIKETLSSLEVKSFKIFSISDPQTLLSRLDRQSPSAVIADPNAAKIAKVGRIIDAARSPVILPSGEIRQSEQIDTNQRGQKP